MPLNSATALLGRKHSYYFPSNNKEAEWSSLCNNVFDQYLNSDDIFTSSDDSHNQFALSDLSQQSNQTSETSPNPSWSEAYSASSAEMEAKQPKARAPDDFWTKKLRSLEQNAARGEALQHKLRTAISYPEFSSLERFPSPPPLPTSPTNQSFSAQRQIRRASATGKKTPTKRSVAANPRSVSRGRPSGVTKASASAAAHPYATIHRSNASPPNMTNPLRYWPGFKDVRTETMDYTPEKNQLQLASSTVSNSLMPSDRSTLDAFATFGRPNTYAPLLRCDDQISPLANTFQQAACIYTPIASPFLSQGSHATPYFEPPPPVPSNACTTQPVPSNDTAPLHPVCNTDNSATTKIQSFDFGFSSSPVNECEGKYTIAPDVTLLPTSIHRTLPMSATSPFYVPNFPNGPPVTPIRQPTTPSTRLQRRSSSSPLLDGDESCSRRRASSRRTSRYQCRAKSTNSTPQQPHGANKDSGFVNFTPEDSNKILNGVAPSGSSKTKAKREREAAEQRRRLSQAAMRAVIEAGGDIESFKGWPFGEEEGSMTME